MSLRPPLAERMRPASLDEIVGQRRWLGPTGRLTRSLAAGKVPSLVLWGPPGCGKTTLARCLAGAGGLRFAQLSAVLDGVKELKQILAEADERAVFNGPPTLLFVDEIHRWNKAQQDALLPHVERGRVVLVGATTENPSFTLNAALRSRVEVMHLDPLDTDEVRSLLDRALTDPRGLPEAEARVAPQARDLIARAAAGDARRALSGLEACFNALPDGEALTEALAAQLLSRADLRHDRDGDDHYDVLSALIKSLRGSDADAGVYWLARLLVGGEDPRTIARRLIIFASEDVGNADPRALDVAVAAAQATQSVGMPEVRIVLAQAVTWLATCPKSNASYLAINAAMEEVKRSGALPVPVHLRNAPTALMKAEGYGVDYRYPHDFPHHIVRQEYLPEALRGRQYYTPADHGAEKTIGERMAWWRRKLDEG